MSLLFDNKQYRDITIISLYLNTKISKRYFGTQVIDVYGKMNRLLPILVLRLQGSEVYIPISYTKTNQEPTTITCTCSSSSTTSRTKKYVIQQCCTKPMMNQTLLVLFSIWWLVAYLFLGSTSPSTSVLNNNNNNNNKYNMNDVMHWNPLDFMIGSVHGFTVSTYPSSFVQQNTINNNGLVIRKPNSPYFIINSNNNNKNKKQRRQQRTSTTTTTPTPTPTITTITTTTTLHATIQQQIQHQQHSVAIAGSLWPVLKKLYISKEQVPSIIQNIKSITEWQEIIILPTIAFLFHPIVRTIIISIYIRRNRNRIRQQQEQYNQNKVGTPFIVVDKETVHEFIQKEKENQLSLYSISERIGQIGQVALSVYIVDVVSVVLTTIGFHFPKMIQLSSSYTKIAYTTLVLSRILLYKKIALCNFFKVSPTEMKQVDILNRILNGIIVAIGALVVSDWLCIKLGFAMSGIFAFGSIGTLAFTLASQGLVTEFVSGLTLLFGNKMYVGDDVIFGDGTSGKVLRIGWLETSFRGNDNLETTVPNALLSSQKVSNVSRIKISQVEQTLRFRYQDAKKLSTILDDIRKEIIQSCPKLIKDSTIRPLRIFWTDFKPDHLQVIIDTHHRIEPDSDEYYTNRQTLLNAILRAVEKNDVELQYKL